MKGNLRDSWDRDNSSYCCNYIHVIPDKSLNNEMKDVFQVEFAPEDVTTPENKEKLIALPATTVEKILQG